uniref:diphthine methyl ester synthase n=1 Tax=Ornithorhynchus anatinus TaxID=9258 RepID=A0A6I8NHU1_ORNAN
MLYLVGLGLGDARDITVKGLQVVQRCSRVYLEAYTSILTVGKETLEDFYGRKLILADRETVEQEADHILKDADVSDVAFLVVGDPFGCTVLEKPFLSFSGQTPGSRKVFLIKSRRIDLVASTLCAYLVSAFGYSSSSRSWENLHAFGLS